MESFPLDGGRMFARHLLQRWKQRGVIGECTLLGVSTWRGLRDGRPMLKGGSMRLSTAVRRWS